MSQPQKVDRRGYMKYAAAGVIVVAVAAAGGYYLIKPKPTPTSTITTTSIQTATGNGVTVEESLRIAREFVKNSPTFQYDGIEETLEHVETLTARCPYCWLFTFTFDSRHGGYGNRTDQILIQVITTHVVRITVERGVIVSAIMDGVWDMMRQEMIGTEELSGKKWVLQSFVSNGQYISLPEKMITIQFDKDGKVHGSGGCNTFFGPYVIGADYTISLGPIAFTEMACPEGMEQEMLYFKALEEVTGYQITPDGLQLFSEDRQNVLDFVEYTQ